VHESLRLILQTEAEARGQLESAQHEAERRVRDAEDEGRRQVHAARDGRDTLAAAVETQLVHEARERAEHLAEGARSRIQAMRALAAPRLEHATEAVLELVLGRDHEDNQ